MASILAGLVAIASPDRAVRAGETQGEMNEEAGARLKAAEADLKRTFEELIASGKGDADAVAILRKSQSAWETYRDAQLQALWPSRDVTAYGSVHPMCVATVKAELTRLRTHELRAMLEPVEGEVCASRWPH
jgi:uncharacterized protein YecT (DUF1311 family)